MILEPQEINFLFCFPGGSAGKESACNAGDPGSIPGSGRSTGEGLPSQDSWASLGAQLAKRPLAMWETWVRSLGWEDPLEKGKATHSSIPAWRIPWTEEPGGLQSAGSQTAGHDRVTNTLNMYKCKIMYELLILIGN